jgi:hypothetical protein
MEKLNKCFEMNPGAWRAVNGHGLQLLLLRDLERYRDKFPNEKDLQDEWKKAVTHPGKYVNPKDNSMTMISGWRGTRRTITIVSHGTWSQRTSSWPPIRSRHKRFGLHQGPMKQSTIRGSR